MPGYTLRKKIGALIYDWPQYRGLMASPSRPGRTPWIGVRNRDERIEANGRGIRCHWQWTSDVHLCKVFPSTGLALMRRAFSDWPVALADEREADDTSPDVTFVIGHRGLDRFPLLQMTLRTIAAQSDSSIECIVVEQSGNRDIETLLPKWVRYIHTPLPTLNFPYCRAWTLNVGAREARGRLLILHDNDTLVPERYACEMLARLDDGADFLELKRFTFYLDEEHTRHILERGGLTFDRPPEAVVQNLQGASIGARRDAFFAIGGFDESFVGWGGEDNDFWDRARTMRVDEFGYLPLVHLWHAPQAGKTDRSNAPAVARYREIEDIAPEERIRALRSREQGRRDGLWKA